MFSWSSFIVLSGSINPTEGIGKENLRFPCDAMVLEREKRVFGSVEKAIGEVRA